MKKNTNVVTLLSYYTIFADLDRHRDLLEEVDERVGLSWGWLQSPAKVAEKVHGVWADCTAGFHCDWLELVGSVLMGVLLGFLSQSLHAPRPHPLPWWLLDGGNYKRCPRRWCPTPRTSHLAREPWSPHQGDFHQLCTSLTVPVCWECLLMPMNDGWHCLASDDVRLSPDLICSLGHDVQILQQIFHTGYMCGADIWGHPLLVQ